MSEILDIYDLYGKFLRSQDRNEFYVQLESDFLNGNNLLEQVKTVRLLLLTSAGEIILQRRSLWKNSNPGLYDKSAAGHVTQGESWEAALLREGQEELGVGIKLSASSEFRQKLKEVNLQQAALCLEVDTLLNWAPGRRNKTGARIVQPFYCKIYIGYYNGPFHFHDGEVMEIKKLPLAELEEELQRNPHLYTEELQDLIARYRRFLKPL